MKKIYEILMKSLPVYFLINSVALDAQFTIMAVGDYNVGAISDNGIVSMHAGVGIFKWDAANGLVQVGTIANGYPASGRTLISHDGTKIASSITNPNTGFNEVSVYNMANSSWAYLGGLIPTGSDGSVSSTWGMSGDGNVIVGLGWLNAGDAHAIKWDTQNGMTDLGSMVSGRSSRANAVNADGSVVVGWQDDVSGSRNGAKWVNGVESYILDGSGNNVGEAGDVSADGSTIIGESMPNPFVWNATTGLTYITHPNASMWFRGGATGISADGSTVIGFFRPFPGPAAMGEGFIWTAAGGRLNLNDYAVSLGINTQGVTMALPLAISQDGKKIAGIGVNASGAVAFYLDLTQYLSANEPVKPNYNISIYPNPVKDILYIKGNAYIEKAEIYNMAGQKLMSSHEIKDQMNVAFLVKGTYILQFLVKGEIQNFKFIKY